MKRGFVATSAWLLAAATLLAPSGRAQPSRSAGESSVDPFYLSLLKDGMQSYEDGRPLEAAQTLRLACFGMLEEPLALTGCLIRLGVAQAAGNDRPGFTESFRRLAEVEERFATYSAASAAIPAEIKNELEKFLVRWIAEEQLAAIAAFEPLSTRRIAAKLRRLRPEEGRRELEQRIADQPGVVAWRVALADLEQDLGRLEQAGTHIDGALALDPADDAALCLKGIILQKKGDCAAAGPILGRCPSLASEPAVAEALLSCQVKAGQAAEARETLAKLPKEWLAERRFERLVQQLGKLPAAARTKAPATGPPATEPEPPPDTTALGTPGAKTAVAVPPPPPMPAAAPPRPAPPPAPVLSEELARKAAQLRQQVAKVQYASELETPWLEASELADNHRELAELQHLAAEIAYRASRWLDAVRLFERGGDPGDAKPLLLFYWAVSLFESGNRPAAETVFLRALPKLNRTPLVEAYRAKILPPASTPPTAPLP